MYHITGDVFRGYLNEAASAQTIMTRYFFSFKSQNLGWHLREKAR